MTTNRAPQREKHPARSARILSTGLAVVTTLGVSSALTISAQASNQTAPLDSQTALLVSTGHVDTPQVSAPSAPGAAAVAPEINTSTLSVQTLPVVPQVVDVPVPAAPQSTWIAPATSGSK